MTRPADRPPLRTIQDVREFFDAAIASGDLIRYLRGSSRGTRPAYDATDVPRWPADKPVFPFTYPPTVEAR